MVDLTPNQKNKLSPELSSKVEAPARFTILGFILGNQSSQKVAVVAAMGAGGWHGGGATGGRGEVKIMKRREGLKKQGSGQ